MRASVRVGIGRALGRDHAARGCGGRGRPRRRARRTRGRGRAPAAPPAGRRRSRRPRCATTRGRASQRAPRRRITATQPVSPSRSDGQAAWEGVAQLSRPCSCRASRSRPAGPAASDAIAQAAVAGSTPIATAGGDWWQAKRIGGRGERAHADLAEHDVERRVGLLGGLGEDRRVPVRDPVRDGVGVVVGDVGERRRARARMQPQRPRRRRPRRRPATRTTSAPSAAIAAARDSLAAAGRKMRAARPRCAAARATARPWLPSLAASTQRHAGLLGEQALERPGRTGDLERRQPEAAVLVLQPQLAEPERLALGRKRPQRCRRVARLRAVEREHLAPGRLRHASGCECGVEQRPRHDGGITITSAAPRSRRRTSTPVSPSTIRRTPVAVPPSTTTCAHRARDRHLARSA